MREQNGADAPKKKADDYRYDIKNSLNWERRREQKDNEIYDWAEAFVASLLLIILVFTFFVRGVTVSGASMQPTMYDGDRLLLVQSYKEPDYGEIVVIDRSLHVEPPIIKRVIGKAGDIINIDFNTHEVWRNEDKLIEDYISEPTGVKHDVNFPVTVPEGKIFVLGDNRNHSLDSRAEEIGMVDTRKIMGKAVFRIYPLNAMGILMPN